MSASRTLALGCLGFAACFCASAAARADVVVWRPEDGGNGHGYEVVPVPGGIGWNVARSQARGRGGYLASVNSAEENAFIYNLVNFPEYWHIVEPAPRRYFGPWLGGVQAPGAPTPAANWSWDDGTPMTYTNWVPGQPDDFNGNNEIYAHFFGRDALGGRTPMWNDAIDPPNGGIVIAYVVEYIPEPAGLAFLGVAAVVAFHRPRPALSYG
jgi:hypothetical protein